MWRVNVRQTLLVVFHLVCGEILVPVLHLNGEDLVALFQLLSIQLIILREVDIHKTRQSMTIRSQSHITILISMLINHLLPQSTIGVSVTHHRISPCPLQILLRPLCLFPIKLLFLSPGLHLLLMLIVVFFLPDFVTVLFLELKVFAHDLVHVVVVDVDKNHLLALF